MSLTPRLNDQSSSVRQFMERTFPNTRPIQRLARPKIVAAKVNTIRPAKEVAYSTIGTAIDYRIRYYFDYTPCYNLVAFSGAAQLHPLGHGCLLEEYMHLEQLSFAKKREQNQSPPKNM